MHISEIRPVMIQNIVRFCNKGRGLLIKKFPGPVWKLIQFELMLNLLSMIDKVLL